MNPVSNVRRSSCYCCSRALPYLQPVSGSCGSSYLALVRPPPSLTRLCRSRSFHDRLDVWGEMMIAALIMPAFYTAHEFTLSASFGSTDFLGL